jgi:hypothetical protein
MYPAARLRKATLLPALFAVELSVTPARADVITDWNAKADAIAAEKQVVNVQHSRRLSMMHVAMFEAVNAIEPRYAPYRLRLQADRDASKEAAAAAAAYDVLLSLYPDQQAALDETLASSLRTVPDGEARTKGLALGKQAAAEILALRSNDGSTARESYRPHGQPGVWVPTVIPLEVTGGGITPWIMTSGSQFRPAPPPALTSETWTRDLNEIREFGGQNSSKRTAEQTNIARFWFLSGPRTYNPVARQLVAAKEMDLVDSARVLALVSMAGADAFVAVFDAKYAFNLWRPMTAIRNADMTGNPATPRDASWLPFGNTPMHPEYPCAHCIAAASVATVLQKLFGETVPEFTLTSPANPGFTRKFTRLQDYQDDVSNARIWAGFHYRFSTEAAKEMGRKIGELAVATQLRGVEATARPTR